MTKFPKLTLITAVAAVAVGGAAFAQGQMDRHGMAGAHAAIAAAVADPHRPPSDIARDSERKPVEMLEFAGIEPGETVVDFMPGAGYFTRIFAKAVGPSGHVFAVPLAPIDPAKPPAVAALAADPAYGNVSVVAGGPGGLPLPAKADVVWTSQNYHDLHLTRLSLDVAAMNRAIYDALKPGGLFIVLDHAAAPGTGLEVPDQLHRINPDIVRREVEAAGFKFVGESPALRNPADDHKLRVFDPAIRGHTDQFIYKFRKPR